jgi:hypothetical protein
MPSIFGKGSAGQQVSSILSDISFGVGRSPAGGSQSRFGPGVGRASVSVGKPETIGQSIEGLGQGILGVVGSIPLVGGLAKSALEVGGGAVGAVGSAIGSFKPVSTGPSVGDVVSGIPGAALEAISIPSKFVQKDIIARNTAQNLRNGNIKDGFGNAAEYYNVPGIKQLLNNNATEDEIANFIYDEGLTFGAKPNIARDLVLGLVTDPLTWVPFGAIASGAARAGTLAKAVKAGEVLAASDAKFWQLWQPVGAVYNAVTGMTSGSSRAVSTFLAGKAPGIFEQAYKASNAKQYVGALSRVAGEDADQVVSEASRLTSYTASRFAKAGAARLVAEESALAVRPSSQNLVLSMSDDLAAIKPRLATGNESQLVDEAIGVLNKPFAEGEPGLIDTIKEMGFRDDEVNKLVLRVLKSDGEEDLIKVANDYQSKFQRNAIMVKSPQEAENLLATRARTQGRSVTTAGVREAIASKRELTVFTNPENVAVAREYVVSNLRYGLSLSAEQGGRVFDELIAPAIREGRVGDALDFLDLTRMSSFGRLSEGIATVRQTFKPGNIGQRITLISSRSLTQARADALALAVQEAKGNPDAVRKIISDAANQYADLYESFGGRNLSRLSPDELADDFAKYLNENKESFVRGITEKDAIELTPQALKYRQEANAAGYELGIAPADGVIGKVMTLTDKLGREYQTRAFSPFADLVDNVFVDPTSLGQATLTYKRNAVQSALNYTFRRRYGAIISEKVRDRWITESNSIGLTTREANETLRIIRNLSDEQQILPRGLALEQALGPSSSLAKAINASLSKEAVLRISERTGVPAQDVWKTVFMNIFKAYNGDLSDLGLMPKFTSWVKMKLPQISIVSDNFFPRFRFGVGAPQFRYGQENVEPVFFRFTTGAGVREERIAGLNKNGIRVRAILGEFAEHNQVGDAQTAFMQAGNQAAIRIAGKEPKVMEALGALSKRQAGVKDVGLAVKRSLLAVDDRKQRALEAMISKGMARRLYGVLKDESPQVIASVEKFLGTTDPEKIAYYIGLDFISRTDPIAMRELIKAGEKVGMLALKTPEERMIYQNVVEAARAAAAKEGDRARRAIYFDPNRPWWERSLNHPLLALYPLSYMVGKVIPEFVRLMVKTPFPGKLGGDRLLLGLQALDNVSDSIVAAEKYDPEFRTFIEDNPEAWLLLQWLVPYTPDNIGFGFSSTARKYVIGKGLQGEGLDVANIPQAALEQVVGASIAGTWRMGFNAADDIIKGTPDLTEGAPNVLEILQGKN